MQHRRLTEGKLTLNSSPPSMRLTMFYLELEWMVREGGGDKLLKELVRKPRGYPFLWAPTMIT